MCVCSVKLGDVYSYFIYSQQAEQTQRRGTGRIWNLALWSVLVLHSYTGGRTVQCSVDVMYANNADVSVAVLFVFSFLATPHLVCSSVMGHAKESHLSCIIHDSVALMSSSTCPSFLWFDSLKWKSEPWALNLFQFQLLEFLKHCRINRNLAFTQWDYKKLQRWIRNKAKRFALRHAFRKFYSNHVHRRWGQHS